MKNVLKMTALVVVFLTAITTSNGQNTFPIEGRWDLVMELEDGPAPSWLEVKLSGRNTLVGRFVYAFGSARPVSHIEVMGDTYHFSIPQQWEPDGQDMEFTFSYVDEMLKGKMTYTDGKIYNWTGTRVVKLPHTHAPKWGSPISLLNGTDLDGWFHSGEKQQWHMKDGVLINPSSGSNLITNEKFQDFKLHVEFRYPEGSNSGVYLRGRYEVQIEDGKGKEPSNIYFGGVYGFITPSENMAKGPGEWQAYDITLIGNRVTLVANGRTVISDQAIPGITGGALDSKEELPGPLLLQGDHGPIEYRNIILTPRVE